jgi:hypothetical protein
MARAEEQFVTPGTKHCCYKCYQHIDGERGEIYPLKRLDQVLGFDLREKNPDEDDGDGKREDNVDPLIFWHLCILFFPFCICQTLLKKMNTKGNGSERALISLPFDTGMMRRGMMGMMHNYLLKRT